MRHFHLLRNHQWAPTINIEKLWSLVPLETRDQYVQGKKTDSAPVIDLLANGYAKLLGKGKEISWFILESNVRLDLTINGLTFAIRPSPRDPRRRSCAVRER